MKRTFQMKSTTKKSTKLREKETNQPKTQEWQSERPRWLCVGES